MRRYRKHIRKQNKSVLQAPIGQLLQALETRLSRTNLCAAIKPVKTCHSAAELGRSLWGVESAGVDRSSESAFMPNADAIGSGYESLSWPAVRSVRTCCHASYDYGGIITSKRSLTKPLALDSFATGTSDLYPSMECIGQSFGKARELQSLDTCVSTYSDTLVACARLDVLFDSLEFEMPVRTPNQRPKLVLRFLHQSPSPQ